jgi:hypothetical protein
MSEAVIEVFALRAAVQAFLDGDARVLDEGSKIIWDEPICDPFMDRLVGVEFDIERQGWVPVIEAGIPPDTPTIEDADGNVVGYWLGPDKE